MLLLKLIIALRLRSRGRNKTSYYNLCPAMETTSQHNQKIRVLFYRNYITLESIVFSNTASRKAPPMSSVRSFVNIMSMMAPQIPSWKPISELSLKAIVGNNNNNNNNTLMTTTTSLKFSYGVLKKKNIPACQYTTVS